MMVTNEYAAATTSASKSKQTITPNILDPKVVDLGGDNERIRPENATQFRFGNTDITFTGAATLLDFNYEDNFNLDTANRRDELEFQPRIDLNTIFYFSNGFYLFSELRLRDSVRLSDDNQTENNFELQVRDLFLNIPLATIIPIDLRLGRQQLLDKRRWFLNDRLDGIRLLSNIERFSRIHHTSP